MSNFFISIGVQYLLFSIYLSIYNYLISKICFQHYTYKLVLYSSHNQQQYYAKLILNQFHLISIKFSFPFSFHP